MDQGYLKTVSLSYTHTHTLSLSLYIYIIYIFIYIVYNLTKKKIQFSSAIINLFQVYKNELHQMEYKHLCFEYDVDSSTLFPARREKKFLGNIIICK